MDFSGTIPHLFLFKTEEKQGRVPRVVAHSVKTETVWEQCGNGHRGTVTVHTIDLVFFIHPD